MKKLLLCGEDHRLLEARAAVLRTGSFEVSSFAGVSQLMDKSPVEHPGLIVLCNSLSYLDRVRAEQWAADQMPSVPVITLARGDDQPTYPFQHLLEAGSGPEGLLILSKRLAV